jgi:hypothetical protein
MMSDGEKKPEDKNLMRLSLQTEIKYSHNYWMISCPVCFEEKQEEGGRKLDKEY